MTDIPAAELVRLDGDTLVHVHGDDRVALDDLDAITFDEARAKGAFVVFTVALLIGPVCGGGAFVIHWFLGIVFAFVPIVVGMGWLLVGVIRPPRLVLQIGDERRVWMLPHATDFEGVEAVMVEVERRLGERAGEGGE